MCRISLRISLFGILLATGAPDELQECLDLVSSTDFRTPNNENGHFSQDHVENFVQCVRSLQSTPQRKKEVHVGGWHHPVLIMTGHVRPSVALQSAYEPCWEEGFTREECCAESFGPRGNPSCWTAHYTYDFCCAPSPPATGDAVPEMPHYFVVPALDLNVGNNIRRYGTFHPRQSYELQRLVNQGDVVVDAGANLGAYTVSLATRVGVTGMVHAFEPFRLIYQKMVANVALNGLGNVYAHNLALGQNYSSVRAYAPDITTVTVPASMQVLNQMSHQEANKISMHYTAEKDRIRIVPLDSLGLRRLKLLKIDVEDMEADVVLGAQHTLRRCRPTIWAESVQHYKAGDRHFVRTMQNLGYACHEVGAWARYELVCRPDDKL